MKYLALVASLLITATSAHASQCAFGESTADLSDHLDLETGTPGKIWYKGEYLSLHAKVRLNGLSAAERKMIMIATNSEQSEEETLADFSASDGYIKYFSHNSIDREFVVIASYPGDNEFGAILELKRLKRGGEYTVKNVAAVISDGDLESCTVSKDEVKE